MSFEMPKKPSSAAESSEENRNETNRESFEKELLAERGALRSYAFTLTQNRAAAEDLVSTVVEKALKNWQTYELGSTMRAWLCTIARNTYFSQMKRNKREVPMDIIPEKPLDVGTHTLTDAHRLSGPLARLHLQEVLEHMDTLNPQQQAALRLVMQQASYEEIAKELNVPLGTAKSMVSRAREKLRALRRDVDDES